jgi:hypothetical protein
MDGREMNWVRITRLTTTELELQSRVLWGDNWRVWLADTAGVSYRTVSRWLAGEPIPGPVKPMLLAFLRLKDNGLFYPNVLRETARIKRESKTH